VYYRRLRIMPRKKKAPDIYKEASSHGTEFLYIEGRVLNLDHITTVLPHDHAPGSSLVWVSGAKKAMFSGYSPEEILTTITGENK